MKEAARAVWEKEAMSEKEVSEGWPLEDCLYFFTFNYFRQIEEHKKQLTRSRNSAVRKDSRTFLLGAEEKRY